MNFGPVIHHNNSNIRQLIGRWQLSTSEKILSKQQRKRTSEEKYLQCVWQMSGQHVALTCLAGKSVKSSAWAIINSLNKNKVQI